ncbi:hypothetical protein D3C81_1606210 [compost metagenome]
MQAPCAQVSSQAALDPAETFRQRGNCSGRFRLTVVPGCGLLLADQSNDLVGGGHYRNEPGADHLAQARPLSRLNPTDRPGVRMLEYRRVQARVRQSASAGH